MKLTDREEAVIKVLLHAKHGVTASELSSALNVSSKTVYRTVSAINEKYCHHDLIKAKIGIGFELDYDKVKTELLPCIVYNFNFNGYKNKSKKKPIVINNKAKATFLYFTRIHLNNILEYLNYFIRNLDKNLSKSVINV